MITYDAKGKEIVEPYWMWKLRNVVEKICKKPVKHSYSLGKEQHDDFDDLATDGSEDNWGRTDSYHNY